jgi:hypothetical protein
VPIVATERQRFITWTLAVPAATPGSIDPAQLEAWFLSSPDCADWGIGIALPEQLGELMVMAPDGLKPAEKHYSPLPETLTFKAPQPLWPDAVMSLFRSPGKNYEVASGAHLSVRDFVHVPHDAGPLVIAPCPVWFKDAHWGRDLECELDLPAAVARAKQLLRTAEPETDQQRKTDPWLKKFEEKEGYEWEPEFGQTRSVAEAVLYAGISLNRAARLMDQYWNVRNKPPLPRGQLRELVEAAYEENDENACRELRWRWARDKLQKQKGTGSDTLSSWLSANDESEDFLCGEVLSTSSKSLLYARTGKGKTTFCLALAAAIAAGEDFLHWRGPSRPRRVLYIDGEMSRRRLEDAARRLQSEPEGLIILSKDAHPEIPPLDTEEGQRWVDFYIEECGPFDLIVFDNLQALTVGGLIGSESWKATQPWVLDLCSRKIAQLWVHHTGHDPSHSYGDASRLWGMDTVIKLDPIEHENTDIAFALKFEKARNRSPENRADFATVQIQLADDRWQTSGGSKPSTGRLELLRSVLLGRGATSFETGLREPDFAVLLAGDETEEIARERKALQNNHSKKSYAGLCEAQSPSFGAREEWRWFVKISSP